jgi:hypothetical protein
MKGGFFAAFFVGGSQFGTSQRGLNEFLVLCS